MATLNVEDVERRLAALERQNRWLKGIGGVALALVGVVLLMGANEPGKVIEAEKFVVKDEKGIARAELGMTDAGPFLLLRDETNKPRVGLGVAREGPCLDLLDETQTPRVGLYLYRAALAIGVSDAAGKTRVGPEVAKDAPLILLRDEAGKKIWSAP